MLHVVPCKWGSKSPDSTSEVITPSWDNHSGDPKRKHWNVNEYSDNRLWQLGLEFQPHTLLIPMWFPLWLSWKIIYLQWRRPGFDSWVGKISWRRERLLTPVFWLREFHGQYSPWGHKESNTTEQLSLYQFCLLWHLLILFCPCLPFSKSIWCYNHHEKQYGGSSKN